MLVRATVESQRHMCYLSLLVTLSLCLLFPHTQFPDGHNSKVMGALERVVSYHTSMVQRSSQVRWDAVGSACWCSHISGKTRAWQSNLLACHCCWLLATLFHTHFYKKLQALLPFITNSSCLHKSAVSGWTKMQSFAIILTAAFSPDHLSHRNLGVFSGDHLLNYEPQNKGWWWRALAFKFDRDEGLVESDISRVHLCSQQPCVQSPQVQTFCTCCSSISIASTKQELFWWVLALQSTLGNKWNCRRGAQQVQ